MKKLLTVVAVISMVAAGCAHKPVSDNCPVAFMDSAIAKCLTVVGVQQSTTPDGRLRIAANLQSLANHPLEMQVDCVFKDEHGFSTGDEAPWQTLFITEHAQETVTFVAMNAQAKKATIRLRESR